MIRGGAGDQPSLRQRTEIRLCEILTARDAQCRAQIRRRLGVPLEKLQKPKGKDVISLLSFVNIQPADKIRHRTMVWICYNVSPMDNPRQVFFNSDGCGITLLAVAVHTLLSTNDPTRPIALFIAHEDTFLKKGGIETIRRIVGRFPFASVWFGDFTPLMEKHADLFLENHAKILWAFPLCDKILPPDVHGKIVYIDIDMLVRKDLGELFDLPLAEEGFVAAAVNESQRTDRQYLIDAGWPEEAGYSFNNATCVLDLDAFRAEHMSDQMIAWYTKYKQTAPDLDQDAQNRIYGARTKRIPIKWNYTDGWLERIVKMNPFAKEWRVFPPRDVLEAILDPCIIHYIGRRKPTVWTHRPERRAFHRAMRELGLLNGKLPGETPLRQAIAAAFDVYHAALRGYARFLLAVLPRRKPTA